MGAFSGSGLSLGTLWVNVSAKVDEATAALQQFGKDTADAIDKQKEKWAGLKNVGDDMTKLGAGLTAGLTLPIVGIGTAAVTAASSFEQSLNKITAVGGQTGADLEKLRAQAMQLGADTKYSAQEAADGMGNLAAAGQSTEQIMASMPGVLDLAAAGELSVARAAEVTSDTLSQFGLNAAQAGHVADVFAQGAAASSISVAQMAESMKYAGPIAKSAGISIEEVATATALLGNAGIKGEQAGTSLRGILSSLVDPSDKAQQALDKLGVTVTDSAGKMLPLDQIFQKLQQSGASTADLFTIFGQNAASAAAALTEKAGPAWAAMTGEIDKSDGAAKRMADTLNSGLAGGFEQLKGSVDTALIALGTALLPMITKLIAAGTEFVNNFILPAVEWFGKLPGPIQGVIIAIAGIAAAIGPVLVVAGTLVSSFATLAPIFATVGAAIVPLIASIGLVPIAIAAVVAGLVALGVWVYNNWDSITAALAKAWDTIKETWGAIWGGIVSALTAIWDGFKAAVEPYWKFITDLLGAIWNVLTTIWATEWKLIVAAVTIVWDAISPYVHAVFDPIVKWLTEVWDAIKNAWNDAWTAAKRAATDVWDAIDRAASSVLKPVAKFLDELWDDLKRDWTKLWNGIKDTVLGIWKDIQDAVGKFTGALGAIGKVVTGIPGKLNDVASSIQKVGTAADKAAGHSPVPEFADSLEDVQRNADALPTPLSTAADKITGVGTAASDAVTDLGKLLTDLDNMVQPVSLVTGAFSLGLSPALASTAAAIDATAAAAVNALPPVNNLQTAMALWPGQAATAFGGMSTAAGGVESSITGLETTLPASMDRTCSGINASISNPTTGAPAMKGPFEGLGRDVSAIITNLGTGMVHTLFEGDGSFAEKGKAALKQLGEDVLQTFVAPASKAIGDFIGGALADLLGKTGLGGVLDALKNIGTTSGEVLGGVAGGAGTAAGGAAGGAASGAGGAGSAAGGVAGAAGSFVPIAGLVTGAISAVSGVISNFQMAGMNKSLDVIVNHTLRIFNELSNFRQDAWSRWGGWLERTSEIWRDIQTTMDKCSASASYLEAIRPQIDNTVGLLNRILDHDIGQADVYGSQMDKMLSLFDRMVHGLESIALGQQQMNVTLTGSDPATVAAKLGTQLRLQGGRA